MATAAVLTAIAVTVAVMTAVFVYRIISPWDNVENEQAAARANRTARALPGAREAVRDQLFIGVKTWCGYHRQRLPAVLQTWFQLVPNLTWIFTDCNDLELATETNGHVINTNCPAKPTPAEMCCNMWMELQMFEKSGKKWFCHVSDDNYVNVPRLLDLLGGYNPQGDWYLGKPLPENRGNIFNDGGNQTNVLSFAACGSGFCLSRALVLKITRIGVHRNFIDLCVNNEASDGATIGYVIGYVLRKKMTVIDELHSHHETLALLPQDQFHDQITFSYGANGTNVVQIDGFDKEVDPTRFLSIHCFLFPKFSFCPEK